MSERGKYIVLEGSDGTGKSTQAQLLSRYNETILGRRSLYVFNDETHRMEPVQEPGGTPTANAIRLTLKNASHPLTPWEQVELFTEARVSIWHDAIAPALDDGIDVITARNVVSTIAYQGYGLGVDQQKILDYTRERVGETYLCPDSLVILALQNEDVRRARLISRGHMPDKDRYESMPDDFQLRMAFGYLEYAATHALPLIDAGDAATPKEIILKRIIDIVRPALIAKR